MLTSFGKFCRKLRIDRGELLKDMATKLGVSSAYLSAAEIGKRNIPDSWIEKITVIYQLTISEIAELRDAYDQASTQIKIDLKHDSPIHRQAAMVFAREFKELDENEVAELLKVFGKLKKLNKE